MADLMGFTADWVRKLVRRYNDDPVYGLKDQRQDNGNKPVLDEQLQQELGTALGVTRPTTGSGMAPRWCNGSGSGSTDR